jgi:hypothetical protein
MVLDVFELSENSPSGPQKPLAFNKLGAFSFLVAFEKAEIKKRHLLLSASFSYLSKFKN